MAIVDPGYIVARGPIATVEIGVEVKILAKAMIKQVNRVINDLRDQVSQFRRRGCLLIPDLYQDGQTNWRQAKIGMAEHM